MRKWTTSACVAFAWSITVPLLVAATAPGSYPQANSHASRAQANASTAVAASVTPQQQPGTSRKTSSREVRTAQPGDTLSAIATDLHVPGIRQASHQAIGPHPNVNRPGVVPMSPRQAVHAQLTALRHQALPPASAATGKRQPGGPIDIPRWLEDLLLLAGVLATTAFASEPVAALARRRRPRNQFRPRTARDAVRARIVLADHERLIVTYSVRDDTVYVLTPPGEDPRAVLRAARLVLPQDTYDDLADHLGVSSTWLE